MTKISESVYLLRVSLAEIRPEIRRNVLVPGDYTLAYLHVILQTTMEWRDYHLHEFEIGGKSYGRPDYDEDAPESLLDERKVTLREVLTTPQEPFLYSYDFGDGWRLEITVRGTVPRDYEVYYPQCIEGARSAPPEDVGGVAGYEHLLWALEHPSDEEEDKELIEWIGGEFDPEEFDLEFINLELRKIFRLLD